MTVNRTRRGAPCPLSHATRRAGLTAERIEEPGAGVAPFALDGPIGDAQGRRNLRIHEPAEIAHFHHAAGLRLRGRESGQNLVECDQIDPVPVYFNPEPSFLIEGQLAASTASFLA